MFACESLTSHEPNVKVLDYHEHGLVNDIFVRPTFTFPFLS